MKIALEIGCLKMSLKISGDELADLEAVVSLLDSVALVLRQDGVEEGSRKIAAKLQEICAGRPGWSFEEFVG
jgi:hypothetical protein